MQPLFALIGIFCLCCGINEADGNNLISEATPATYLSGAFKDVIRRVQRQVHTDIFSFPAYLDNLMGRSNNVSEQRIEAVPASARENPHECYCGQNFPNDDTSDSQDKTNSLRIISGSDLNIRNAPWMAQLIHSDGENFCGGTVINNRYILTAAHCVAHIHNESDINVILGETRSIIDDPKLEVEEIKIHPMYNKEKKSILFHRKHHHNYGIKRYDIALLKLQEEIRFSERVWPICLALQLPLNNQDAIVTGWGTFVQYQEEQHGRPSNCKPFPPNWQPPNGGPPNGGRPNGRPPNGRPFNQKSPHEEETKENSSQGRPTQLRQKQRGNPNKTSQKDQDWIKPPVKSSYQCKPHHHKLAKGRPIHSKPQHGRPIHGKPNLGKPTKWIKRQIGPFNWNKLRGRPNTRKTSPHGVHPKRNPHNRGPQLRGKSSQKDWEEWNSEEWENPNHGSEEITIDGPKSDFLQVGHLKIMNYKQCKANSHYTRNDLNPAVMCGEGVKQNACDGDDGGPLAITNNDYYYQVGITSWRKDGCMSPDYPTVFTNVAWYAKSWIREQTEDAEYCKRPKWKNQPDDDDDDYDYDEIKSPIGVNPASLL